MEIRESSLCFTFEDGVLAIKFDDGEFYRKFFNQLPGAKGVDILTDSKTDLQFIEIKNCMGHERENLWRLSTDNRSIESAPRDLDVENRESLDIEMAKKIVATLTCMAGAWTKSEHTPKAKELMPFWKGFCDGRIVNDKKKINVVLFLEGDFDSQKISSRSKTMIMKRLQDSINKKLSWLNCRVSVVDSDTYNERYFKVEKITA